MKLENKIKLWVAIGLFIAMGLITFDLMAQQSAVRNHTKLQKEYSFEVRLKDNESFTLPSAKQDLKKAKKKKRKSNKKEKEAERLLAIRDKIKEIDQ